MEFYRQAFSTAFSFIFSFDSELYFIVWTSLKISLIAILLASIVCIPTGLLIANKKFPGKSLFQSILNTMMALPTVVIGLLLYGLLSRKGAFGDMGLLYTQAAIVIGQCVLIFPVVLNLVIAAASSADKRIYTTAKALGGSSLQQGLMFINEIRFAIMSAVILGFGRAIGELGIAMMLGGNIEGFTRTMTTAIALETSKGEFEFALALGLLLLMVAFSVNIIFERLQRRQK